MSHRRHVVVVVLLGLLAWGVYALSQRPLAQESDQAWHLDVARHVAAGLGRTSNAAYPAFLPDDARERLDRVPFVTSPPLQTLVLGAFVKVLGPSDTAAVAYGLATYLAFLVGTYLLGAGLLGDRSLAAVAAVLVGLEPHVLRAGIGAGNDLLFGLGSLGLFATALLPQRVSMRWALLSGAALVGLQLIRYNAGVFLPGLWLVLWQLRRPWTEAAVLAAVYLAGSVITSALAGVAPSQTGSLAFLYETRLYPGFSAAGAPEPAPPAQALLEHPDVFVLKWARMLHSNFNQILEAVTPYAGGFVIFAGLLLLRRPPWRERIAFLVVTLGAMIAVTTLTETAARLYLPFVPPALLVAVAGASADRWLARRALPVLVLAILLPFLFDIGLGFRDTPRREARAADIAELAGRLRVSTTTSDWIATDLAEDMAWRADRPTLRLPNDRDALAAIERRHRDIDYVLLTTARVGNPAYAYVSSDDWATALRTELPGYTLAWEMRGVTMQARLFRKQR